jgi:hypothetical protein
VTTEPAETTEQRYDRLATEYQRLRCIRPDERTDTDRARFTAVTVELLELAAIPPDGYTLPAAATSLIAHARTHRWDAWAQWTPDTGTSGGPFVAVYLGRTRSAEPGDRWHYQLTWHSRGCPAGRVRRFGSGLAQTPDNPAAHHAPSMRAIREVIAQHPAPGRTS